MEKRIKRTVF